MRNCFTSWFWVFCLLTSASGFLLPPQSHRTFPGNFQPIFVSLSPSLTSPSAASTKEDSQALLEALLIRHRSKEFTDFDIGAAIRRLKSAKVSFDPAECFNGPLYVVLHQQGPKKPLWEKIGLAGKQTNIQGQRYVFKPETKDYDIVNYAEILGKGIFIQVEGTAKCVETPEKKEVDEPNNSQASFLDGFTNLFAPKPTNPQSAATPNNTLQCPCDVVAAVAGGGLYVGGNKLLPLDFIQGTGVTRVLYADPNLRILESPYQNNGGWEDQGLIVVQVREDLLSVDE